MEGAATAGSILSVELARDVLGRTLIQEPALGEEVPASGAWSCWAEAKLGMENPLPLPDLPLCEDRRTEPNGICTGEASLSDRGMKLISGEDPRELYISSPDLVLFSLKRLMTGESNLALPVPEPYDFGEEEPGLGGSNSLGGVISMPGGVPRLGSAPLTFLVLGFFWDVLLGPLGLGAFEPRFTLLTGGDPSLEVFGEDCFCLMIEERLLFPRPTCILSLDRDFWISEALAWAISSASSSATL